MSVVTGDFTFMVNQQKVKIARFDFEDGDDRCFVAALDKPTVSDLAIVAEYVPSWAPLYDVEYEGEILTLTFVGVRP